MRVNPKFANMQYMYANGDTTTGLPEGTYSNLAATKYVRDNDKNKDGKLSTDEVTLSQEAFDKLDADKSGKIDLKEMKAGLKGQDAAIEAYYKKKKTTAGNSKLTSDLVDSSAGTDTATAKATPYSAKAAASYIDSKDTDSDDSLSREEAALASASFDTLDTDKNGKLSQAEVQAALKAKEEAFGIYYKNNVSSRTINGLTSSLLKTI